MKRNDTNLATVRNVHPMTLRRRVVPALGALAGLAVLGGCAQDAPQDTWDPAGENAQMIHNLQWPVFTVAGIVLVIVCVAVAYSVVKFRDRGQAMPEQTHGKPALEIALTILPALILVGVGIPTVSTIFDLADTSDTECVRMVNSREYPIDEIWVDPAGDAVAA